MSRQEWCPACDGGGFTEEGKCHACNGSGKVKVEMPKATGLPTGPQPDRDGPLVNCMTCKRRIPAGLVIHVGNGVIRCPACVRDLARFAQTMQRAKEAGLW